MRPLRFFINLTVGPLFGRVTYQLMETAWRPAGLIMEMPDWVKAFAATTWHELCASSRHNQAAGLASVA